MAVKEYYTLRCMISSEIKKKYLRFFKLNGEISCLKFAIKGGNFMDYNKKVRENKKDLEKFNNWIWYYFEFYKIYFFNLK